MCIRQGVLYEKGYHMNTVTVNQLASSSLLHPAEVVSLNVSFLSFQGGQVRRGDARNDNPGPGSLYGNRPEWTPLPSWAGDFRNTTLPLCSDQELSRLLFHVVVHIMSSWVPSSDSTDPGKAGARDANLTVGQVAGTHKHIKTETFGQKLTLAEITFIW